MPSPTAAEEHLRIIRSLMEKATIYRAISAQAALVAGALACAVGAFWPAPQNADGLDPAFHARWFGVLVVSIIANLYFLHHDARRRSEPFVSAGMRMALRAMIPPLLCGGVISLFLPDLYAVVCWLTFYGLAALTTVHFAPRSLERLGWAFLLTGLAALILSLELPGSAMDPLLRAVGGRSKLADFTMAATFGFLHLAYAACTWRRAVHPELREVSL